MNILEVCVFGLPDLWCNRCQSFKPAKDFEMPSRFNWKCLECRNEIARNSARRRRAKAR